MPTWVIQCVEAITVINGRDPADGNEPLFVDCFANDNYFSAKLHEGGTAGVAQDNDEQVNDNDNVDYNNDKETDDPTEIALEPAASCGEISGVPHQKNQWNSQEWTHQKSQWNSQETAEAK